MKYSSSYYYHSTSIIITSIIVVRMYTKSSVTVNLKFFLNNTAQFRYTHLLAMYIRIVAINYEKLDSK